MASNRHHHPQQLPQFKARRGFRKWRSLAALCGLCLLSACSSMSSTAAAPWTLHQAEVYAVRGDQDLTLDVYQPQGGQRPHPAVLVIHGGGWARGNPGQMQRIAVQLADAGFAVANITYRLAPEAIWPAQIEDAADAVRWLRHNAGRFDIDPNRIGAWGYSAGAHLAALLAYMDNPPGAEPSLAGESAAVQALVGGGTPTDLTRWPDSPLVNDFLGQPLAEARDTWRAASPLFHVDADDPPTYLYHGKHDYIVAPEQAVLLRDALQEQGVPVTLSMRNFGHIWVFLFARSEDTAGREFLVRTLGL